MNSSSSDARKKYRDRNIDGKTGTGEYGSMDSDGEQDTLHCKLGMDDRLIIGFHKLLFP